jgi:hypothetical protein
VLLKVRISESELPSIARQLLGNQVSCIIVWVTRSHNAYIGRLFPRQRIIPNCSIRCSLSGQQRNILRGWLTELRESEGSDNKMRDSKEDAGQKRSRTVKSEVVNL